MITLGQLLWGTAVLRPYVFLFFLAYLLISAADWGWRRTGVFTLLVWAFAFAAEYSSTRNGIPFGLYVYHETTRDRELWISNVPFMDSLSFAFLAYASFGLSRLLFLPVYRMGPRPGQLALSILGGRGGDLARAVFAGAALMTLLDVVIDPLAVRGGRWFLGDLFHYPEGGLYFGVPLSNFLGWFIVGAATMGGFCWMEARGWLGGSAPAWAATLPWRPLYAPSLYCGVLGFNLAITWAIGEVALFLAGCFISLPLALLMALSIRTKLKGSADP